MFNPLYEATGWCWATGKRFLTVMPRSSLIVMAASLVAKVSLILSLLLPIKVILLLGAEGTPRYFPAMLQGISREVLIIVLSTAALGFYLLNAVANKIIDAYVSRCADFLLNKNKKLTLYHSQQVFAESVFSDFMTGMSGLMFFVLALVAIYFLYPHLLLVVLLYLFLAVALTSLLLKLSPALQIAAENGAKAVIYNTISALGFFIVFVYIVTDFLLPLSPPGLISALLGLILTRQALSNVLVAIKAFERQYNKQIEVEALFFQGKKSRRQLFGEELSFWDLFEQQKRANWLIKLLGEVGSFKASQVEVKWYYTGLMDVASLVVRAEDGNGENRSFFVQIYEKQNSSMAVNNKFLLEKGGLSGITLNFVGEARIDGYTCHLFDWLDGERPEKRRDNGSLLELRKKLMMHKLPKVISDQYSRSHPLVWQRVNAEMIQRLCLIADAAQRRKLIEFEKNFEFIKEIMAKMPLQLVFYGITNDSFLRVGKTDFRVLSWKAWGVEPMGYGLSRGELSFEEWGVLFDDLKAKRSRLAGIPNAHFFLVAHMSAFEHCYKRRDFVRAIESLVKCADLIEENKPLIV